ncbi:MAG: DNA polymerase IV [Clostridia bacterium]|jgi:DNA polymerase-4|nr:DNA polymerase IV [Clostridia bacterium]
MEEKMQTKNRVILHADVNNFFASVECSNDKSLFDKPVAVTGNPEKRTGIILAKNEIAKKFGIKTGQVIGEAKALCPDLICLAPHYDLYEDISKELHNIYLDYTNYVEPLGLDECWLDITGCEKYLNKTAKQVADELRERVKKELSITISVGVSFSKIFAKLGSDMRKPDFTTEISYQNFKQITYSLPLNSIVGIGRRLEKRFSSIGIKTIGDFVMLEDDYLNSVMGITGINLKNDLLGLRDVPVLDYYKLPPPKSVGNGTTTIKDISSRKDIEKVVYFLAQKISHRMIKHNVIGQTIYVKLKSNELKSVSKSMKIPPTNSYKDIAKHAMVICDLIYKYNYPLRAIRVKVSSLSSASARQLSMFDNFEKDSSITIDQINSKYGKIFLASNSAAFINSNPHPQE